jgi:beta-glucosidase
VARDCVRHSLVLLKNANNALPLSKQFKHLVVVGKAADDIGIQCGGWTIAWQGRAGPVTKGGTTILAGIRKTVSAGTTVTYSADGSDIKGADAVVVVVGEMPYAEMKGDRANLQLSAADQKLIATAKAAGAPTVTLLISGRPLVLGDALDKTDALLAAWLPGTEGQGVADVLFGDFAPTGKLPRTWPLNAEQVSNPSTAAQKPLFPYGFGLTYMSK